MPEAFAASPDVCAQEAPTGPLRTHAPGRDRTSARDRDVASKHAAVRPAPERVDAHPHPQGVPDALRESIRRAISARPKDAFGKGVKKPSAKTPVREAPASSAAPAKKGGASVLLGALVVVVVLLWALGQAGGCAASCARSPQDAPGSAGSSASPIAADSAEDPASGGAEVAYVDDEREIAEVADAATSALKSLPTRSAIVDHVAAGLDGKLASRLDYTAGECGLDSRELARWLMRMATGTVDQGDVYVYSNGTASVFVQMRGIPVYAYVSKAYDIASAQAGWKDGTPEGKKHAIAFALEAAKGSSSWSGAYISFDMKKARAGWELDEQAFFATADHLYGL